MTGINSVRQQNCVTKISMQPNITQKKKKDELNKVLMCIYRQLKYSKQNTCYITSYKPIEFCFVQILHWWIFSYLSSYLAIISHA